MDRFHGRAGGPRNDDTFVFPRIIGFWTPQAGEGKERLVRQLEVVGLSLFPFVKTVGKNQAAADIQQGLKRGFSCRVSVRALMTRLPWGVGNPQLDGVTTSGV